MRRSTRVLGSRSYYKGVRVGSSREVGTAQKLPTDVGKSVKTHIEQHPEIEDPVCVIRGGIYDLLTKNLGRPGADGGIWVTSRRSLEGCESHQKIRKRLGLLKHQLPDSQTVVMAIIVEPKAHRQEPPKKSSMGATTEWKEGGFTSGGAPERVISAHIPLATAYMPSDQEGTVVFSNIEFVELCGPVATGP